MLNIWALGINCELSEINLDFLNSSRPGITRQRRPNSGAVCVSPGGYWLLYAKAAGLRPAATVYVTR